MPTIIKILPQIYYIKILINHTQNYAKNNGKSIKSSNKITWDGVKISFFQDLTCYNKFDMVMKLFNVESMPFLAFDQGCFLVDLHSQIRSSMKPWLLTIVGRMSLMILLATWSWGISTKVCNDVLQCFHWCQLCILVWRLWCRSLQIILVGSNKFSSVWGRYFCKMVWSGKVGCDEKLTRCQLC